MITIHSTGVVDTRTHDSAGTARLASSAKIPLGAQILTATISPDGVVVATGAIDGTVQFWDTETGQQVGARFYGSLSGTAVNALSFSPDGTTLAVGGEGGRVWLWNVSRLTTFDALATLRVRLQPTMTPAAWTTPSHDGISFQAACTPAGHGRGTATGQ